MDEQFLIQETLDTLYSAIESLPDEYKDIFEMSYVKGLKTEEVAQALNLSVSGTKKRKARFIELLREKLSTYSDDPLMWMLFLQISQFMSE